MSDILIAIIVGGGGGGWLFFQLNHRTGVANSSGNVVVAGIGAIIIFVFILTLLKYILHIG